MHELSIANELVTIAEEALRNDPDTRPDSAGRVDEVHLRLGALAGVVKDALLFCYEIATENTMLAGSRLVIDELPVIVYCADCDAEVELPSIQNFCCPRCGTPSGDVRQGREMELTEIHFQELPVSP